MGKSIFDLYPKESFENIKKQALWKEYEEHFGERINLLFGDDYAAKLRFGSFYRSVIDGRLKEALRYLKAYKEHFISEYDLSVYNELEQICLNTENMKDVKPGDWIKYDFNMYYLVLDGNIENATIKYAFNSKLEFVNTLDEFNYFTIKKTNLYCYRRLDEEEQKQINDYLINNQNAFSELNNYTKKCFDIYSKLIDNGFTQSSIYQDRFYKYLTNQTAFIINVRDHGKFISIVYGINTVSLDKELRNHFENFSEDDDNITLRKNISFSNLEEEILVNNIIKEFYYKYETLNKEQLLTVSKEKRKEFIDCFKTLLKPYGLKKKSNKWSKDLNENLTLNFYLNKSIYSDVYYLDLWINVQDKPNRLCYSKRYSYYNNYTINWQFLNLNEFMQYLKKTLIEDIDLIINSKIDDLHLKDETFENTFCEKNICDNCKFNK